MNSFKQAVIDFIREEEGLTVVEYAIAGGLIGLGVVTMFENVGNEVARIMGDIWEELQGVVA